jgi:hypothetical protein
MDELVISVSAKGLTTGDVQAHLAEIYGAEVSRQTVSTITDKVIEGMAERGTFNWPPAATATWPLTPSQSTIGARTHYCQSAGVPVIPAVFGPGAAQMRKIAR